MLEMLNCNTCHRDYESGKFCGECGSALIEKMAILNESCPNCGYEEINLAKFCPECGENLQAALNTKKTPANTRQCPKCDSENSNEEWKFCQVCGYKNALFNASDSSVVKQNEKIDMDKCSREMLIELATSGHLAAQKALVEQYDDENDEINTFYWLQKAAMQEDAEMQFTLGSCHYTGACTEQNYSKALEWFEKAASQGHPQALCAIGLVFDEGYGVKQNKKKAHDYYLQAADKGDVDASFYLGLLLADEDYREYDDAKAFEYLKMAADAEHCAAQLVVSQWYFGGRGTKQSFNDAGDYLIKSMNSSEKSKEEILGEFIDSCATYFHDDSSFYVYSKVPEAKMNNAMGTFLRPFRKPGAIGNEEIKLFCDNTLLGSAKSGIAMSSKHIAWKEDFDNTIYFKEYTWTGFSELSVSDAQIELKDGTTITVICGDNAKRWALAELLVILHKASLE
jgi:hypothetical protein